MRAKYAGSDGEVTVELSRISGEDGAWLVSVDGREQRVRRLPGPPGCVVLATEDDRVIPFWIAEGRVLSDGEAWPVQPAARGGGGGAASHDDGLEAPMPGTVLQVRASVGDVVEADQVLLVIEAMKMEHAIRAPRAGTITALPFAIGDRISAGDRLAELESSE